MFNTNYEIIPIRKGERMFSVMKESEKIEKLGWEPIDKISDYIKKLVDKYK